MDPTEVKARVVEMEIWNDSVWVNHHEKIFFVPIWRNANTTFMNDVAAQFGFKLEKNVDLTNYIGFTIIRHPHKRLSGQIWRACINHNFSIEYVLSNLRNNVSVDIHMNTQTSFLESYNITYYLDLDNLMPVGHNMIDEIVKTLRKPKKVKDSQGDYQFALKVEEYINENSEYKKIVNDYYKEDRILYCKNFIKVGIIGLGNIGGALHQLLKSHDIEVAGYDIKKESDSLEKTLSSDLIWICVDTPTAGWGDNINDIPSDYNVDNLQNALSNIKNKPVIVGCTVSPGTCRKLEYTGPLYYMPFLISQGNIHEGLKYPDCWFLGSDGLDNTIVHDLVSVFSDSQIHDGTLEEAELAKVLYNSWIIQKINFANWAGDLSRAVGNANSNNIMNWLINSNKLITSGAYMKPGWGDGGPCHPRDNLMMSWLSQKHQIGYDPALNNHITRIKQAELIAKRAIETGLPVRILGKSYKKGIKDTTGSYSLIVAQLLKDNNVEITWEDSPNTHEDLCYILAHNEMYNQTPSTSSVIINLWNE